MRSIKLYILTLIAVPLTAFAAAEGQAVDADGDQAEFRVVFPPVDAWAQGTVCNVDSNGIVISGTNMPLATAHAKMRLETQQQLAGIDDPQQRLQVVKKIKAAWHDRLEAAAREGRGETKMLTFTQPADNKVLVVLDAESFRQLPFFEKRAAVKEQRQKMGLGEGDLVDLYRAREARLDTDSERPFPVKFDKEERAEAAGKVSEKAKERLESAREKLAGQRLSLSDLKEGDKVFIGYDMDTNTAFSIIRKD